MVKRVYIYGARSKTFLSGYPYYLARALESLGLKTNAFEVVDIPPMRTSEVPLTYLQWCIKSLTTRVALFRLSRQYHNRSGWYVKVPSHVQPYFIVCSQNIPASILAHRRARPDARIVLYLDATFPELFEKFDYAFSPPKTLKKRMLRDEKTGYDQADMIAVFHEGVRNQLINAYGLPPEKIRTIGRGINFDFDYASKPSVAKKSAEDGRFHMMVVGRGPKRKGVFRLIEAIDTLTPDEQSRIVLTVAGPAQKELPSRPYLTCLGFITAEQRDYLTQEMTSNDLGVLMSDADSMPGSVWEFLALGVPVWVSDLPSIRTALQGYPALIENLPLTKAALAARLRSFLAQPEILANLLAHNKRPTKELTWDVQAELIGQYIGQDCEAAASR